jgi:hypothetical protein
MSLRPAQISRLHQLNAKGGTQSLLCQPVGMAVSRSCRFLAVRPAFRRLGTSMTPASSSGTPPLAQGRPRPGGADAFRVPAFPAIREATGHSRAKRAHQVARRAGQTARRQNRLGILFAAHQCGGSLFGSCGRMCAISSRKRNCCPMPANGTANSRASLPASIAAASTMSRMPRSNDTIARG